MKPLIHAKNSARKFGGKWEDYIQIHEWLDQTKMVLPDIRHRMVLHNSWGIYMGQDKFGHAVRNSDGRDVAVREILEQHVIEDLGFIPTLETCFEGMAQEPWMGIRGMKKREISLKLDPKIHNIEIVD